MSWLLQGGLGLDGGGAAGLRFVGNRMGYDADHAGACANLCTSVGKGDCRLVKEGQGPRLPGRWGMTLRTKRAKVLAVGAVAAAWVRRLSHGEALPRPTPLHVLAATSSPLKP